VAEPDSKDQPVAAAQPPSGPAVGPDAGAPGGKPQPIEAEPTPPTQPTQPARSNLGSRLLGGLIVAVAVLVLALIAAAFLPRWWAHRIGGVADGSFTAGIAAGLACGVAFTALPLAALRGVVRRHRSWTARFAFLLLAGLLAAPNLITLGIVLGTSKAAHAGERTMDVDAPGFRGATLVGAALGTLLTLLLWSLLAGRRRRMREIARLKDELRQQEEPRPAPPL
jgi:MFS family permease